MFEIIHFNTSFYGYENYIPKKIDNGIDEQEHSVI